MFAGYNGAMAVNAVNLPPIAYLICTDTNQIAVLDTVTTGVPVDFAVYRTRPIATGDDRNRQFRVKRVRIYGSGTLTTAQLYLTAENGRTEAYPYVTGCSIPSQGLLWQQYSMGLVGRWIDATVVFQGTDVQITQLEWEICPIN
jgi:hypothetical protein